MRHLGEVGGKPLRHTESKDISLLVSEEVVGVIAGEHQALEGFARIGVFEFQVIGNFYIIQLLHIGVAVVERVVYYFAVQLDGAEVFRFAIGCGGTAVTQYAEFIAVSVEFCKCRNRVEFGLGCLGGHLCRGGGNGGINRSIAYPSAGQKQAGKQHCRQY